MTREEYKQACSEYKAYDDDALCSLKRPGDVRLCDANCPRMWLYDKAHFEKRKTMTREEAIRDAAETYDADIRRDVYNVAAFRAGARWADGNPQSPWVSMGDKQPATTK